MGIKWRRKEKERDEELDSKEGGEERGEKGMGSQVSLPQQFSKVGAYGARRPAGQY